MVESSVLKKALRNLHEYTNYLDNNLDYLTTTNEKIVSVGRYSVNAEIYVSGVLYKTVNIYYDGRVCEINDKQVWPV